MRRTLLIASLALAAALSSATADEALEQGRTDFAHLCAPCHGESGKGDGPQAATLQKKTADLTVIATKHGGLFPEELVFQTVAGLDMPDGHGTREMPIWGDVFVTEGVGGSVKLEDAMKASDDASRRIAGLVRYIRSIQASP
ncbi:cytochrome c [Aestuariivirga sp.]|uniref:c-type cytochrome n=1 Tax=Aestuariivirga sp. TaxID=2650926 RepID=UPI003593758A